MESEISWNFFPDEYELGHMDENDFFLQGGGFWKGAQNTPIWFGKKLVNKYK